MARTSRAQEPAEDGRRGRTTVRDKVLRAIEKGAGSTVYIDDISKDYDLDPHSVRNGVRGLIDSGNFPQLEVAVAGRAWRWNANASKASKGKRMFEELTTTKAGVILVQDEDGNVYKLEEL